MPRSDDKSNRPGRDGGEEPLDFGEFVSSNVQRTSDLLKGEPGTSTDAPSAPPVRPGGDRSVARARDGAYWRRKAAGAGIEHDDLDDDLPPPQQPRSGRNRYLPSDDSQVDQFHDENEFGDQGGGFGGFFADFFSGDGEDGNRNRIIAAIIALVVLLLIIFGVTRLFSDGDVSDDSAATPTTVIEAPSTPASGPEDLTGDPDTPEETEEPEIPRGGDNQRGEGEPLPDAEATEVASIEITSEIARACPGFCLVRMEGADQQSALDAAGARVSWADGDISWLVVTPTQTEIL